MDKYSYQKVLGMGNFGKAWLVRSRESRRPYVIKEVNVVCMGEKERERAVNEVAILGRLRHVNIIRYREAFVAGGGGILAIVMEYGDGGDLAEKIEEAKLSGQNFSGPHILNWFVQLCLALYYMHSEKVLHRDLKPSNLFLTSKGLIKVGDFGIAKMLRNTLDHASTAIGTPYYLSPEICQNQPYNQKSDMWAAGCILYELVTLTRPFEGLEFSTLIMRILGGVYTPIPRTYGTVIEELVAVLLSVNPAMRPSAHAILTSHNIRPFVKAFTDQRDLLADSPSPLSEKSSKSQSKKSQGADPRHGVSVHSPYAITPSSIRNNASRRVRRFHHPEQPSDKLREQSRRLKPRTDSPMIKDNVSCRFSKRQTGTKPRSVHLHSASEPTHLIDTRTPSHYTRKPARALSQRKSARKPPTSAAPRESHPPDDVSRYGRPQLPSQKTKRDSPSINRYVSASQEKSHMKEPESTSSSVSRKRRSCIPDIDGIILDNQSDMSSKIPSKKRRQSLPERVKDSKFLSRLVSSESRTSKRLQPKTTEKNVPNAELHQRPRKSSRLMLKSKTARRKSEPATKKSDEARPTLSPTSKEKPEVRKIPRTGPATKTYQRPRKESTAPITCLFPKAPEASSSRPRTRIKHGTYTLNLPNLSVDDQQAPSKCDQCKCRQGRRASSRSNSVADVVPSYMMQTPTEETREMNVREVNEVGSVSESSCHLDSPGSPVGNFRRRNALRRRSRDYVPMKRDQRGRDDRHDSDIKANRLGAKPDVIPPIEDEVFLEPVEPEESAHLGKTLARTCSDAMELKQDFEIAEFLHAGMEKPGDVTSDLRGKLELLKMYLERRLGAERSSVAYNILSSASCQNQRTGSVTDETSEEVVRLVADVLGPGKMSYFPVLVEVVNLSNHCH